MSNFKILTLKSEVKEFHIYRSCLQPQEKELLDSFRERTNLFDMFFIQVYLLETNKKVVTFPDDNLRTSKVLLGRGAKINFSLS